MNDLVIVYICCYITFKCTYQICDKSSNYIAIKLEIVHNSMSSVHFLQ